MKWTDIPHGAFKAADERFWQPLGDYADVVANRLANDKSFAKNVAEYARMNAIQLPESHLLAKELMGANYLGVIELMQHMKITPTREDLASLETIPWSPLVLQDRQHSHVLVAVFPRTLQSLHFAHTDLLGHQTWYLTEAFARERVDAAWHLVRKTAVPGSLTKRWDEQKALLTDFETVPTMSVLVYAMIAYFRATGQRLFTGVWGVRSCDEVSGSQVYTSGFSNSGINIHQLHGGPNSHLGIASELV